MFIAFPVVANDFPVADLVVVEKGERKLHLIRNGEAFRTFDIALGIRPEGDKEREGDFRTPEGRYMLDMRKDRQWMMRRKKSIYWNC